MTNIAIGFELSNTVYALYNIHIDIANIVDIFNYADIMPLILLVSDIIKYVTDVTDKNFENLNITSPCKQQNI